MTESEFQYDPNETRRRNIGLIVAAVVLLGLFMIMGSQASLPGDDEERLTSVEDLTAGTCFLYPGDGVVPTSVETVSCSEVHYAEVVGTVNAGDDEACVTIFESYTGVENYWETDYILGFIPLSNARQHCYLYAAEDFAGSLRA